MNTLTVESEIHFHRRRKGASKTIVRGPDPEQNSPVGRIPRVSRLMALAIRFDALIREGEISDYAELARLANVSRARVTQIMNLLMLAPDIQEEILFLDRVRTGNDPVIIGKLQSVAMLIDWRCQRTAWELLLHHAG